MIQYWMELYLQQCIKCSPSKTKLDINAIMFIPLTLVLNKSREFNLLNNAMLDGITPWENHQELYHICKQSTFHVPAKQLSYNCKFDIDVNDPILKGIVPLNIYI